MGGIWNLFARKEMVSSSPGVKRRPAQAHFLSVLNQCSAMAEKPNETEARGKTLAANGRLANDEKTLFSSEGSCADNQAGER